jgi:phenylacetate-CoA ligase
LPILTPRDLHCSGAEALASELPEGEAALPPKRSWTSLSTPIDGPLGLRGDVADKAQWEALAYDVKVDTAGRLAAILPSAAIQERDLAEAFGPWAMDANRGRANRWQEDFGPEPTLAWLQNIRPSCLFADPTSLKNLLAIAEPGCLTVDDVVIWRPAGSAVLGEQCRRTFSARLIEVVASDLCGFVAFPSGAGDFAPALETSITEIVDDSGAPCRAGEAGRLVTTGLYSYLRPVIRLDLGLRVVPNEASPGGGSAAGRPSFRILR